MPRSSPPTTGVHYGYRIIRGYGSLAAGERLAAEQVRRLSGVLAVKEAEQTTEHQLWSAAMGGEVRR